MAVSSAPGIISRETSPWRRVGELAFSSVFSCRNNQPSECVFSFTTICTKWKRLPKLNCHTSNAKDIPFHRKTPSNHALESNTFFKSSTFVCVNNRDSFSLHAFTKEFSTSHDSSRTGNQVKGKVSYEDTVDMFKALQQFGETGGPESPKHMEDSVTAAQKDKLNLRDSDPLGAWLNTFDSHEDMEKREWASRMKEVKSDVEALRSDLAELLGEVNLMQEVGNTAGALSLIDANLAAVTGQLKEGGVGLEQVLMLETLAQLYFVMGLGKKAEEVLDTACIVLRIMEEDGSEELSLGTPILHDIGELFVKMNRMEDAYLQFYGALNACRQLGAPTQFVLPTLISLGALLLAMDSCREAISVHVQFLQRMDSEPSDPFHRGRLLFNLGLLLRTGVGKKEEAEAVLLEAAECFVASCGEQSYEVAATYAVVAQVKMEMGKTLPAEALLEWCSPVLKEFQGSERLYLESLFLLADVKLMLGKKAEAVKTLKLQVEETESLLGGYHPGLLLPLMTLAQIDIVNKNWESAIGTLVRCTTIQEASERDKSVESANTLQMLALCLLYSGKLEKAEAIACELLAVAKEHCGEDNQRVLASSYMTLGMIMNRRQKWRRADQLLKTSIQILETNFGLDSLFIIEPLENLVETAENIGEVERSASLQERLRTLKQNASLKEFTVESR